VSDLAPIRWGILATGGIAKKFAHDLHTVSDARLVAVGSRAQATADDFAREFNVPHAYGTYNGVLNDPDVDVVYVATTHDLHMPLTLAALNAGKHVLCEKPIALNTKQATAMVDLARKKNLFLMEAIWARFHPVTRKLYELVNKGVLGQIRMLQADFGINKPFDPQHRLYNPEVGGGAMLDLGIYPIQLAIKILGVPETVTGTPIIGATGVDEQNGIVFGYSSGALAVLTSTMRVETVSSARIYGTNGYAVLAPQFWHSDKLTTVIGGVETVYDLPHRSFGYQDEIDETHRCIRAGEGESPIMPLDDTLTIQRIMDGLRTQWGIRYPQE
jgi:predicted dehydrogenase